MTKEEIEILLKLGEGYNIEFKKRLSKDISNEICSFLNSSGGTILVGINDDNNVEGIVITNEIRSNLQATINSINPKPEIKIEEFDYNGKTIIAIECPSGNNKPYICSGSIYVRMGSNSQKLIFPDEMRNFFQQQNLIYFEETINEHFKYPQDFDNLKFKKFIELSKISGSLKEINLLENLQLVNKKGEIKNGCILFFAKTPEKFIQNSGIRCLHFKGKNKRYILDDKFYSGDLLEQYEKALVYIKSKLELRYEIESQGTKPRLEILEIPEIVFKESLINALSHRDYFEKGAVINIEIYDDRVEITNPGGLVNGISEKDFGKRSLTRNPLIFGIFHRLQLVEKVGSGIVRMREAMFDSGLPSPQFNISGIFSVTFYRPVDFSKWIFNWKDKLNNTQIKILEQINFNNRVTYDELAKNNNLSKTGILNNIKKLKEFGLIERHGSDKTGIWMIVSKCIE